jgi:tetratricopeptide (TPR) repeat protein
MRDRLRLKLMGRLCLLDPAGAEIAIPSAKAKGLLALLGTAPTLRRPRAFVQDKLWSDSPPEKGAANLRQMLTVLRRSLDRWQGALLAEPGWLGLDPRLVEVALDPAPGDWGPGDEAPAFAEGLDIADPEFEDWLRDQRFAAEDRLARLPRNASLHLSRRPAVLLAPVVASEPALLPLAELALGEIAAEVHGHGFAVLVREEGGAAAPVLRLCVRAAGLPGATLIHAMWHDARTGLLVASARRMLGGPDGAAALEELVAEAAVIGLMALLDHDPAETGEAGLRAARGIPVISDGAAAARADALLATGADRLGALAWAYRAQLRVVASLERFTDTFAAPRDEALALIRQARELDPASPVVKAMAADVALHLEKSPAKALALSSEARRQAPFNPVARASFALALASSGQERHAHDEAVRALRLASSDARVASWQVFCAVTALRCGRLDEAEHYAALAHDSAPAFRPPIRFLAALRYRRGDEAGTAAALRTLKEAEPDFDPLMLADPEYPAASLRFAGLTAVARSGLL